MSDTISRQAAIETVKKHYRGIDNDLLEIIAYEMEELPPTQPSATDTNVDGTNDTISRQAILDAVDGVDWYHQNKDGEMVHGANSDEHQAWYKADDIYKAIESVPSAQPGCEDTVYRKAVQMLLAYFVPEERYAEAVDGLRGLPSAQPEHKKGKWIKKMRVTETEKYISYDPEWYCACCGTKYDPWMAEIVNFCYVCGADMRGDAEGGQDEQ